MSLAADNDGGYQDSVGVPLAATWDLQLLAKPGRRSWISSRVRWSQEMGSAVVWLLFGVLVTTGQCKMGKAMAIVELDTSGV